MNEEDVKAHIILPWLEKLGVAVQDLSFETSFAVQIGRRSLKVGGSCDSHHTKRARLDMLLKRRGIPLVVFEVKAPSIVLDDNVRDQAISYARLVHPIAPLALVTNGTDFQLFDSITKERISPQKELFDGGLSVALPDADRLEALRVFFDLSTDNLVAFCKEQVQQTTRPLFGNPSALGASYIPAIHVERKAVTADVRAFVQSNDNTYVMAGDSGVGKTGALIDIATHLTKDDWPVLFFRGVAVEGDILDAIAHEVEWAFGHERGAIETLKRLAASAGSKPIVVIVDGVESLAIPHKVRHVANLVGRLKGINVRLLVSCKTGSWEQFTTLSGENAGTADHVYGATAKRPFSMVVPPLTAPEFSDALAKHRNAYGVRFPMDEKVQREAKAAPFLLRLLFQTKSDNEAVEYLAFEPPVFEQYLERAAARTSNPAVAVNTLIAVAGALYQHDEEWIPEEDLRQELHLGISDALLPDLFEHHLLVREGPLGAGRISFGFDRLRSYLIAFHVRRWPRAATTALAADVTGFAKAGVRAESLSFYYPFASRDAQHAIDGDLRENAKAYLNMYRGVLDTHFPQLRAAFSPRADGPIGFAAELYLSRHRLGLYGFRRVQQSDDEVLFVPVATDYENARLFLAGVDGAHSCSSAQGFRALNITEEVINQEICRQLREIVKKGRLNDIATPDLAEELILNILRSKDLFRQFVDPRTRQCKFPLSLADVTIAYKRTLFTSHFRDRLVDEKLRNGQIDSRWHGSTRSYSYTLTASEQATVQAQVDDAITSGRPLETDATYTDLESIWRRLDPAIRVRTAARGDVISSAPLSFDLSFRSAPIPLSALKEHSKAVLQAALQNYRQLVVTNFPTFHSRLAVFQKLPIRLVLVLRHDPKDGAYDGWLAWSKRTVTINEVVVLDEAEARVDFMNDQIVTHDGPEEYSRAESVHAGELLRGRFVNNLEFDSDQSVLRRWVYRWIQEDLDSIVGAIWEFYNVQRPAFESSGW